MKLRYFVFDLDGTLIDSSGAILASLRQMEKRLGLHPLPDETLRTFLGPPLRRCFMEHYHVTEADTEDMVSCYRTCYMEVGIDHTEVFPGAAESLRYIRAQGGRTAIATMKQPPLDRETLRRTGLETLLDYVALVPEHSVGDKAELVEECLAHLDCGDRHKAVLLGDTPYDGLAAARTGIFFAAAGWGGSLNERECAAYGRICVYAEKPQHMWDFIRRVL